MKLRTSAPPELHPAGRIQPDHVFMHTTVRRVRPRWWAWEVRGLTGHAVTERGAYRRAARAYTRRAAS